MKNFSIVIGNFDGVHLGHQALLSRAKALGERLGVLTFHPHPAVVLNPAKSPVRILDYLEQERALKDLGVAEVLVLAFTKGVAQQSGEDFFDREILSRKPAAVTVGEGFRFGRDRGAGVDQLRVLCERNQIQFCSVAPLQREGRTISSTWVRECLQANDFQKAHKLLGRAFEFGGIVMPGRQLGRTIGFPTANLRLAEERRGTLPISEGVFAGQSAQLGPFVMNVGRAPTVHSQESDPILKVEVHFLSAVPDLYGKRIEVQPQFFIRREKKFASVKDLRRQILLDVQQAKQKLEIQ